MKQKLAYGKWALIAAVIVCVAVLISTAVSAANQRGIRNLSLKKEAPVVDTTDASQSDNAVENAVVSAHTKPAPTPETIALQGYSNSAEHMAAAEWFEFTEEYDAGGEIITKIGNGPTGLDERYSLYLVYTQDMADKLDEITAKYGLMLHSEITDVVDRDIFMETVASGDFAGENPIYSGYMYEDSTFKFDSEATLSSGVSFDTQFLCCKKGSFTDILLTIGNSDDYTDWSYITFCGVTAELSMSPYKSLVTVESDTAFVTINVLAGSNAISAAELEEFADSFDYSLLK